MGKLTVLPITLKTVNAYKPTHTYENKRKEKCFINQKTERKSSQTYNCDGLLQTSVGISVSVLQIQVHLISDSWVLIPLMLVSIQVSEHDKH